MTNISQLDDLLPNWFDEFVKEATGKALLPIERDGVLSAVTRSLLWSYMRSPAGLDEYERNPQAELILETESGLSTNEINRDDIISRMDDSSGLGKRICRIALDAIECELEEKILYANDKRIFIAEIGSLEFSDKSHNRIKFLLEEVERRKNKIENIRLGINSRRDGDSVKYVANYIIQEILQVTKGLREKLLAKINTRPKDVVINKDIMKEIDNYSNDHQDIDTKYKVEISERLIQDRRNVNIIEID